jgi:hypothetical protein
VIADLDASQSTHGIKYVCSECAGGDTAVMYYPEITGFNRKELPAGTESYIPFKSAEEKALEELKLHRIED